VHRSASADGRSSFRYLEGHPRARRPRYTARPRGIFGRFPGRDRQDGRGPSHEHSVGRTPHPRWGGALRRLGLVALLAHPRGAATAAGWPRGLASQRATSRVLEGNIRDRHQAPQVPQSDTPNGLHRSRAGLWPAATGADNRRPSRPTLDHDFEAELERPIRLQVVAGPRNGFRSNRSQT